jgi:hypothetical protein
MERKFNLKDGRIVKIVHDDNAESPRDWDNIGKMVCFHRRYNLGDEHNLKSSDFNGWDEIEKYLREEEQATIILPLYLFDHSGITMSTHSAHFRACDSAGWDWGQVGFIYATDKDCTDEKMTPEQVEKYLCGEVETYAKYLEGDIWGFEIWSTCCECGEEKDVEDSCYGFYGDDPFENGMSEHWDDKITPQVKEQM